MLSHGCSYYYFACFTCLTCLFRLFFWPQYIVPLYCRLLTFSGAFAPSPLLPLRAPNLGDNGNDRRMSLTKMMTRFFSFLFVPFFLPFSLFFFPFLPHLFCVPFFSFSLPPPLLFWDAAAGPARGQAPGSSARNSPTGTALRIIEHQYYNSNCTTETVGGGGGG